MKRRSERIAIAAYRNKSSDTNLKEPPSKRQRYEDSLPNRLSSPQEVWNLILAFMPSEKYETKVGRYIAALLDIISLAAAKRVNPQILSRGFGSSAEGFEAAVAAGADATFWETPVAYKLFYIVQSLSTTPTRREAVDLLDIAPMIVQHHPNASTELLGTSRRIQQSCVYNGDWGAEKLDRFWACLEEDPATTSKYVQLPMLRDHPMRRDEAESPEPFRFFYKDDVQTKYGSPRPFCILMLAWAARQRGFNKEVPADWHQLNEEVSVDLATPNGPSVEQWWIEQYVDDVAAFQKASTREPDLLKKLGKWLVRKQ
ncbi:hypothetical protein B0H63DRAFT_518580 [Podospora didyma]|uniref:Uncharacterized protein n=1 Tax=Podospora didyma TaxID=330526 RepID=A0AAE0U380_9PEZI|nr:hypothetical protein B0H63DRAFT_518580 [Podospora didyma]